MVSETYHSYIGRKIKGYTVLSKLGDGGSAHVYLAQNNYNDRVAIKVLDSKYLNSKLQQLFLQEAQFLQELKHHQHILPIIDYGESEGTPYIIVEYAPGGTLRERINTSSPFTIEEAFTILVQVGKAIDAAHQHNIVHSDLKPENILFNRKNEVVLADFGIAVRLEVNKELHDYPRGTYAYMSPEQFDGKFTKEGDQYALGCIAYELLTGKHPFEHIVPFNPHNHKIMQEMHKYTQPYSPRLLNDKILDDIEQVIIRALAKKTSERYTCIASFIHSFQISLSSPSHSARYFTEPLNAPPPDTLVQEESRYLIDPQKNNATLVNIEEYGMAQLKEICGRALHSYSRSPQPVLSFPKNLDKENHIKNTDYSLPLTTRPTKRSKETTQRRSRNPQKILLDLRLPPQFSAPLSPPLKRLGLTITSGIARDEYIQSIQRQYTVVLNNNRLSRALLYIPSHLLDKASSDNISAIRDTASSFPKHSTIIIFSNTSRAPAREIKAIMDKQWLVERGISSILIPERYVQDLNVMDEEEQERWFLQDLRFQELTDQEKQLRSMQQMESTDSDILVGIIEKLPQLIDDSVRGWRTLLESAGLGMISSEFDFRGASGAVAWDLIRKLKIRARLPDKQECEVLGWLLSHILSLADISTKDQEIIKSIIRKYELIPDSWKI